VKQPPRSGDFLLLPSTHHTWELLSSNCEQLLLGYAAKLLRQEKSAFLLSVELQRSQKRQEQVSVPRATLVLKMPANRFLQPHAFLACVPPARLGRERRGAAQPSNRRPWTILPQGLSWTSGTTPTYLS